MSVSLNTFFCDAPASFMQTFAPSNSGFPGEADSRSIRPVYHIQRMGDFLRRRFYDGSPDGWPGNPVGSEVKTLYPNILAEAAYSPAWPGNMGPEAGISEETMCAVLEDGVDLDFREIIKIAKKYRTNSGYLISPVLSMVRPDTHKGRYRLYGLKVWAEVAQKRHYSYITSHSRQLVQQVILALENGIPVPYAAYRWALREAALGSW